MGEITWKEVPGYEGLYRVSNVGQIQNIKRGKYLKSTITRGGYARVYLYDKNIQRKAIFVHRIVCMAFHENPQNLPQVNHINMDKLDNSASNLEWCSPSYNIKHSYENGGREHNKKKLLLATHKEVLCLNDSGEVVKEYFSLMDAARDTGSNVSNICACCHGRVKKVGGYKWKLK